MLFSDENEEVWSNYDESDEGNLGNQSDKGPELLAQTSNDGVPLSLLQWLLGFFLLLQAQFSLSEKVINMIFRFLKLYFNVLGCIYAPCTNIAAQLPLTSFMTRKCYTGKHLCKATFQRFLFVKDVVLYGIMMTVLKGILYVKLLNSVHTHHVLVEAII